MTNVMFICSRNTRSNHQINHIIWYNAGMLEQPQPTDKPVDKPNLRTLKNGAIYDMDKKRIVANPGGGTHAITSENASEFHQARLDKKRAALLAGASRGASDILQRPVAHEWEWVEILGEANMHRAADPGNPKGVDATKMLLQETGLGEAKQQQSVADSVPASVAGDMLLLLRDVMRDKGIVIDADVVDG